MLEFQSVIVAVVGLVGTIMGVFLNKMFTTKKDFVDIQSSVIQNLWDEITRLKTQVEELKNKETAYEVREKELTNRITELEKENKNQALEIQELKKKLK